MTIAQISLTIVGTAVSVGLAIAAFFRFAMRALVNEQVIPVINGLTAEAKLLRQEFESHRALKEEQRKETNEILSDLRDIVQSHETTLAEHQLRLAQLEQPVVAKRRAAR